MKSFTAHHSKKQISAFPLSLLFLLSGVFSGMFGSGGGILAVFALKRLINNKQDPHKLFATTLAIIFPTSAICSVIYSKSSAIPHSSLLLYLLPGFLGGIASPILSKWIKGKYLNLIFSLLIIVSGFTMIF